MRFSNAALTSTSVTLILVINSIKEFFTHYEKYGKNAVTLKQYMALNKELHWWMDES
jgi:hypothetical protein